MHQQEERVRAMLLRSIRNLFYANAQDLIQCRRIKIRVASLYLVSFRHLSDLWCAELWPTLIYIIFSWSHIPYRFLSNFRRAGVLSSEVKYDIFRNGDEGTWLKRREWSSQHNVVDTCLSSMSQTSCSGKKPPPWKPRDTHTESRKEKSSIIRKKISILYFLI